jgi:hypothetical protein
MTRKKAKVGGVHHKAWIALADALKTYIEAGNSSAVASIEALLRDQLPTVSPEESLLKAAIRSGSARCLEDLLRLHGSQAYQRYIRCASEANLAQVKVMTAARLNLAAQETELLYQAFRLGDAAFLRYLRHDLGMTKRLIDAVPSDIAIEKCRKPLAPALAAELRDEIAVPGSAVTTKIANGFPDITLKYLALALLSGRQVDMKVLRPTQKTYCEALRRLIEQSTSAHGRLALAAQEQSFEDVLARPVTATFFGLRQDEAFRSPIDHNTPTHHVKISDILKEWPINYTD